MNDAAAATRMRPLAELPRAACAGMRAVLTDVDGTLTTDGRLTAAVLDALERLHEAGLLLVGVTGGPAGWCDHMIRCWPLHAVIGESGAFWFRRTPEGRVERRFTVDDDALCTLRERRERLAARVLAEVPGAALAVDQAYRELDLAVDWCENVTRLAPDAVARIERVMHEAGARTAVSLIHVNAWSGDYDKLATSRRLLEQCYDARLEHGAERARYLYVGDAPNDAPAFGFFDNSVGVANVTEFGARMPTWPRWVTRARCGAGFVELADHLLAAHRPG